ncbi:acyl-CoA dehydrogenase [Sphingomonas sp. MG17]|uniref:Acyl-CoA dehydrogenase n=1 Tax=Sphingomonas tagetis TaxID=2949092 RepID=A0A9X2KPE2_9SPHN|nr:acyl-CoA dehydrogenase [Sphingomonas tagetis]
MTDPSFHIGRQEIARDYSDRGRMMRLSALLDHDSPPWRSGVVPPLGHWLCFTPLERQSGIGADGHPVRTDAGLLPNVGLPRRMWVGSRIEFLGDLPLDVPIIRTSTLVSATPKSGRTGDMLFVTVKHEIARERGAVAIVEEQDIVYREAAAAGTSFTRAGAAPGEPDPFTRSVTPDPVMLFRYSALTFNSHRIHYDRDYARSEEGYPSLVIHGPLIATLLLDHLVRQAPDQRIRSYHFRAASPLLEGDRIELGLTLTEQRADLRAIGPAGIGMTATAELAA